MERCWLSYVISREMCREIEENVEKDKENENVEKDKKNGDKYFKVLSK